MARAIQISLLLAIGVLALAGPAAAYPVLQGRIPSGYNVPCPPGVVSGCDSGICDGVGHHTCRGGSLPLNPFGEALGAELFRQMAAAGLPPSYPARAAAETFAWTKQICEADADGDGQSNGVELGDPCCAWAVDDATGTAPDPAFLEPITHPGFATAMLPDDVAAARVASCAAVPPAPGPAPAPAPAPAPTPAPAPFDPFAPGEPRGEDIVITANATTIPAADTTYMCTWVALPAAVPLTMVGWEAILDSDLVHHMILYGCGPRAMAQGLHKPGDVAPCPSMPDCVDLLAAWAAGRSATALPADAGFSLGAGSPFMMAALQIHYNNPNGYAGRVDSSGLRLFVSPAPRPHPVAVLWTGPITRGLALPPNATWEASLRCAAPWANASVFGVAAHAHLTGREVDTAHAAADGTPLPPLLTQPHFSFNNQGLDLLSQPVPITQGDLITTRCVYDTSGRPELTVGAEGTRDEMCIDFLFATGVSPEEVAAGLGYACAARGDMWVGPSGPSNPDGAPLTLIPAALSPEEAFAAANATAAAWTAAHSSA